MNGDSRSAGLDVYARAFVPQRLRDVNLVPAQVVLSAPPHGFDYAAYTHTFAGTDFLINYVAHPPKEKTLGSGMLPTEYNTTQGTGQDQVLLQTLHPRFYKACYQASLDGETTALQQECEDYALYRVCLSRAKNDSRPSMFTLHVPGLRESSLRIEVGDIVQLRQLYLDQRGEVTVPFRDATQHNGAVWGIDRRNETLALRVDFLYPISMLFNVCFTLQNERLKAFNKSLERAQHALDAGTEASWMRSMLFPEGPDGCYQKMLNRRIINIDFHDPLMNYEQSRAIDTVVNQEYGPVPLIISGPPGTGKTKTVVELALQLIKRKGTAHLLICAPSDSAADTLVNRLSAHMKPPHLLRVNAPSRSFPEVSNTVLPYCYVAEGIFSLPSFQQLMQCKAVVTTCRDANILLRARVSNKDLFNLETKLSSGIHPGAARAKHTLHWTGLLMDEAAQATEPEALIPLNVIAPPDAAEIEEADWPLFIMAGDQHQLGPRTASKVPRIQTSLFERLLARPFYHDHPLARSKGQGGVVRPLTQAMLPILRPAFADLIRNYRSHPAILATPSSLFYHDTLEPQAADVESLRSWPEWRGRGWPVLFRANFSPDEIEQDGGGWYNAREARLACGYAGSFVRADLVQPHEICIMSPFQAQVKLLRSIARTKLNMPGINIGPLEAFQGLESRLVILCTTRTRDRFIDQDVAKGLGVIHEPKRFNVALTRAKEGLIVIGNPKVLVQDPNWAAWLRFCHRNRLCDGRLDDLWVDDNQNNGSAQSRLERQLVLLEESKKKDASMANGMRKLGLVNDPDDALWDSGLAAEELVQREGDDTSPSDF